MKFIKFLIFILILIVVIYLVLCSLGPKSIDMSKETTIDAPPSLVYNLINNLPSWENWMPTAKTDTTMKFIFSDKKQGIGASYSWTSKDMGNGNRKIVESEKDSSLKTEVTFQGLGKSNGTWIISEEESGTKVSWEMQSEDYLNFFKRGILYIKGTKGQVETNFDDGLANIKKMAEARKNGEYNGYRINTVEMPEKHYVIGRSEVPMNKVQQFYTQNLSAIFTKVLPSGLEPDGMPSGLFFKRDESNQKIDMATAIPLKEPASINGTTSLTIPAKQALQIEFYGDTANTKRAHQAMEAYLMDKGLLSDVPVVEEYVTDPALELDPEKYLTKVTYYLAN